MHTGYIIIMTIIMRGAIDAQCIMRGLSHYMDDIAKHSGEMQSTHCIKLIGDYDSVLNPV